MTEDVSQLSVAELLARNGQQAAPSGGGGGRRRRSGRGISVADLTGDIPVVGRGPSSHAAPDEAAAEPAAEPTSTDSDFSNYSNFPNYSDYSNFSDYSDFSSPSADPQPDYSSYSVPDSEPAYSPLSGPISFYDPLAPTEQPDSGSLSDSSGYSWSSGIDWPPAQTPPADPRAGSNGYGSSNGYGANGNGGHGPAAGGYGANGYADPAAGANGYAGQSANGYAAPNGYQTPDDYAAPHNGYPNGANGSFDAAALLDGQAPAAGKSRGGRRRKPDPLDDDLPLGEFDGGAAPEAPREGGRRRRFDPDDESTDEVHPFRGDGAGRLQHGDSGPSWSAPAAPQAPPRTPGFDPMQAAAPAPAAPPMSRSARRHAEAQRQAEADRQVPEPRFGQDPRGLDQGPAFGNPNGRGGRDDLAAPNGRGGRDDLAPNARGGRDDLAPGGRGAGRDAREDDSRRGKSALAEWTARRRPAEAEDVHDDHADSWAHAEEDQQLLSGETVAGDLLRDARDRAEERNSRRGGKRRAGGSRRRGAAVAEPDPDEQLTDFYEPLDDYDEIPDEERTSVVGRLSALASKATRSTRSAPARGRGKGLSEDDENRRQWLVLGGQSAGAAVAGMLLFKGFERMWELLPWVALALAMVVILGLVALVRVLRRTDDIFSTVIAVVVGVFVTLGPLAFLLSTN